MVKPHFYRMKEDIMQISRDAEQLSIQGHPVQVFADLFPTTFQSRCSFKPFFQTTLTCPVTEIYKVLVVLPFSSEFYISKQDA